MVRFGLLAPSMSDAPGSALILGVTSAPVKTATTPGHRQRRGGIDRGQLCVRVLAAYERRVHHADR